jgi:divalent metal cation (Fe/Co/Zn/Cd) transporter
MAVRDQRLLRRGLALEYITLGWNVVGVVILAFGAVTARSVALAGFGLDSLVEIGASLVVVWELTGAGGPERERRALRLIGAAFFGLATYIGVQAAYVLAIGARPEHSPVGIAWTAVTCVVMLSLAYGKAITGRALGTRFS